MRNRSFFFSFNDTAPTEIYTLSLHDALPISSRGLAGLSESGRGCAPARNEDCFRRRSESCRPETSLAFESAAARLVSRHGTTSHRFVFPAQGQFLRQGRRSGRRKRSVRIADRSPRPGGHET